MARKWMPFFLGVSITCSLVIMIQICTTPGVSKPDTSWMAVLRNLSSLIKTEHESLFLPPLPRCDVSSNRSLLLVVVVCSSTSNFAARLAIRSTWANETHLGGRVKVFFIVGRSRDNATEEFIGYEEGIYEDMIRYDMVDSYRNLTVKSLMMLQWVQKHCRGAQYILKTDDDMFVNVPNLLRYLVSNGRRSLLMGHLISKAPPVKEVLSKWYTPGSAFDGVVYPDYLSGTCYVMSQDVVPVIYSSAFKIPLFFLEDVFITGMCAKASELIPTHHKGFSFAKRTSDPCLFKSIITAHRMSVMELYQIWDRMQDPSVHCME